MGGGLLQLVAHGAQDAYLTTNPQITFWKGMYKRHTNFAMEAFRVNLTGMPMWGQKQSATLGRHADLVYSTYLDVVLPIFRTGSSNVKVNWNNEQGRLGYMLLDMIELEIGGQLIDRLYSEWLYLWDVLSSDYNKSYKLYNLVGLGGDPAATDGAPMAVRDVATGGGTTPIYSYQFPTASQCMKASGQPSAALPIYVPLPFFYTKNPGAALPLIALQYHEVKINIQWNKAVSVSAHMLPFTDNPLPPNPTSAAIYVDYIYLDVDERRRMAQESHEYLIEQVQFNEEKGIGGSQTRIDLTFNHPVKELVWVVQPDRFTNCKQTDKLNNLTNLESGTQGAGVPRPKPSTVVQQRLTPFTYTYMNQADNGAGRITDSSTVTKSSQFTQPVREMWLQFNGQDRIDRRGGSYFNSIQPFQHHTGTMKPHGFDETAIQSGVNASNATGGVGPKPKSHQAIYSYSFALKPEESQPSGTCNFSRIDTATIVTHMSGDYVVDEGSDNVWNVRVYAINYNILRIMSGMAGLAYSN
jgi:hypothetical protein